jgi:hypothetical protein
LTFILVFPLAFFLFTAVRAVLLAREGEVPPDMRDLDCDGKVSFVEWLRGGLDFRLRPRADGCTEIVHAKSGQVLVVRCETEPRCRVQARRR